MDYLVWGAMLEAYRKLKTKLKTSAELKEALQVTWDNLPQGPIDRAVKDFSNSLRRLEAGVVAWRVVNTLNIPSDNGILASDHYLTALFQRCY